VNGEPREVTDAEEIKWSCIEASTSKLRDDDAAAVAVVCTPSGGAQSVRLGLPPGWGKLADADLLAAISRARNEQ
jgi:hypothetical protein